MNKDWVKIYSSTEIHKIEIVKAVLEDNGIQSFEINKKDSSYTSIGEIELYVNTENEILANLIINENSL
jgi:putative signal transducing protein